MKKKYIFTFLLIFLVMCGFLAMFFYFNLILLIIVCFIIVVCSIMYLFKIVGNDNEEIDDNREYELEKVIKEKNDSFSLDTFYLFIKDIIRLIAKSYSLKDTNILENFVEKSYIKIIDDNIKKYKEDDVTREISNIKFSDVNLNNYYILKSHEYYELIIILTKNDCFIKDGVVETCNVHHNRRIKYKCVIKKNKENKNFFDRCPICNNEDINHGKCTGCGYLVNNMYGYYLEKFEELD